MSYVFFRIVNGIAKNALTTVKIYEEFPLRDTAHAGSKTAVAVALPRTTVVPLP
jgi:hypothetical protein